MSRPAAHVSSPPPRPPSLLEPLGKKWKRRAVSLTAVALYTLLVWSTCWITLPVAGVIDLVTGRRAWPSVRFVLLALGYPLMQIHGLTFVLLTAPLAWHPRAFHWMDRFQVRWGSLAHRYLAKVYSMGLEVEGLEALEPGPVILLMRHTSQADTLLIPHIVGRGLNRSLRYVLKKDLRADPCFDLIGARGHHAFVSRGKDPQGDREQITWLLSELRPQDVPVIYPEGTRTSPEKRAKVIKRLEEKGESELLEYAQRLRHLLPPRLGGVLAMLEDSPGCDIVFCGHVGLEGASRFDLFREGELTHKTVRVIFWRVAWRDVPEDEGGRRRWILDQWQAMDDWVEEAHGTTRSSGA